MQPTHISHQHHVTIDTSVISSPISITSVLRPHQSPNGHKTGLCTLVSEQTEMSEVISKTRDSIKTRHHSPETGRSTSRVKRRQRCEARCAGREREQASQRVLSSWASCSRHRRELVSRLSALRRPGLALGSSSTAAHITNVGTVRDRAETVGAVGMAPHRPSLSSVALCIGLAQTGDTLALPDPGPGPLLGRWSQAQDPRMSLRAVAST